MAESAANVASRSDDRYSGGLVFGVSLIVFLPVLRWLATTTLAHEQLLHALMVLVLAAGALIYERRVSLKPEWRLGRRALGFLIAAYAGLGLVYLSGFGLLVFLSLALFLAGLSIFVFGNKVTRVSLALLTAFVAFTALTITAPLYDWPLRQLAGQNAGWILGLMGKECTLGLAGPHNEPSLILEVAGRPFHVAAECNGFGVISASILLGLLLTLYRRIALLDKVVLIAVAAVLGFVFNALRIVAIILLAPHVGDHYLLMHEIIGTIFYYGALGIAWWLIQSHPGRSGKPSPASNTL